MKCRSIAILLMVVGLALITYPTFRDYYYDFKQKKIVEGWQESLKRVEDGSGYRDNPTGYRIEVIKETEQAEALLVIDKINLKVPILNGVNEQNLNLGVARMENTGKPGEVGNFCVAGHRSRTYGLLFNRLDELEKGDRLVIKTRDNEFIYLVADRFIVNPDHVEVLQGDGQKKQITLVTCDYSSKPYLRLIIQGELQS